MKLGVFQLHGLVIYTVSTFRATVILSHGPKEVHPNRIRMDKTNNTFVENLIIMM